MGTLSAELELKFTSSLTSGSRYLSDSLYAITIPDNAGITEYNPKVLQPNVNDLSKPESSIELLNINIFLSIQSNRKVNLDIYSEGEVFVKTLVVDRLFFSVSPMYKVIVVNPDLINPANVKILYS